MARLVCSAACGEGGRKRDGDVSGVLALDGEPVAGAMVYDATCGDAGYHGRNRAGSSDGAAALAERLSIHHREAPARDINDGGGEMELLAELRDQPIADVMADCGHELPAP